MSSNQTQNTELVSVTSESLQRDHPNDALVVGCVDDSPYAPFVTDYAAWATHRLGARLELLHVIDRSPDLGLDQDHSGALTANEQAHLLEKIVDEEAQRSRIAREKGRVFLNTLRLRAMERGVSQVDVRQRHGTLSDSLLERESQIKLVVMGRKGESLASAPSQSIGRNLERVARALKRPILSVTSKFTEPQRILIAFDGSRASRKCIDMVASSRTFEGLDCLVVMVKDQEKADAQTQLRQAAEQLNQAGLLVSTRFITGELAPSIKQCIRDHNIDPLVMGAYTHSPWRSLILGSHTTRLLQATTVATLLLR